MGEWEKIKGYGGFVYREEREKGSNGGEEVREN